MTFLKRRHSLAALSLCALGIFNAQAQDYPTRQITLIAPWPAGGAVDALCRAVAPHLSDRLGKSVVVENRPGAGSVIGTAAGAKAAPRRAAHAGQSVTAHGSIGLAVAQPHVEHRPEAAGQTTATHPKVVPRRSAHIGGRP